MLIPGFPAGVSVCSLQGRLLREADLGCQEGSKMKITKAYSLEEFGFLNTLPFPPKQLFVRSLVIYSEVYVWGEHFSWAVILEIKQMCELSEFELIEVEMKQLMLDEAVY